MIKVYTLTNLGKRLARSTRNPDTAAWRIVHHLDNVGQSTSDQIAGLTGLDGTQSTGTLASLKRKGIITEISASTGDGY